MLVRADFNVPLAEDGSISDDSRIEATEPTIRYLVERGATVILMSHLGRPKGRDPKLSLAPVAARLGERLGREVVLLADCVGPEVAAGIGGPERLYLLENLRFHPEEEANDPDFARQLAALADLYVDDAFGAAHRAHASVVGVTRHLPSFSGFLLKKEVEVLGAAMERPQRPLVVVLGGAKVADKIGVVDNLLEKADRILLGGGMAFTFLKAEGREIGRSLLDEKHLGSARATLERARAGGQSRILLPVDVVAAPQLESGEGRQTVSVDAIPPDLIGVDIGPTTAERFAAEIRNGKTVIWNGPMGVFEVPEFAEGTRVVARAVREVGRGEAFTIIGGGDTVAAVEQLGFAPGVDHLSTGGGASLEFLEGRTLPGVAALG